MEFYKLVFDRERIDQSIESGFNTIFGVESNLDEIEFKGVRPGFFRYMIDEGYEFTDDWPEVKFYYSSLASDVESEYLLNAWGWPIIHQRVQKEFEGEGVKGIQYLPIELIDEVTGKVNNNYVVMNVLNVIEAYDMEKSKYNFNETLKKNMFLPMGECLDKEVCKEYDVFRAIESTTPLYVSEKIKRVVEESEWIGFDFYKQWTN